MSDSRDESNTTEYKDIRVSAEAHAEADARKPDDMTWSEYLTDDDRGLPDADAIAEAVVARLAGGGDGPAPDHGDQPAPEHTGGRTGDARRSECSQCGADVKRHLGGGWHCTDCGAEGDDGT